MVWPRYSSLWWKDVAKLGDFGGHDWFNLVVERKVGNGFHIVFGMIGGKERNVSG